MSATRRRRGWAPGDYAHTARADGRPILGATIPERWERLWRLKSAIAAAGWSEGEANRHVSRVYGQVGVELLTAGQADDLIGWLAADAAAA